MSYVAFEVHGEGEPVVLVHAYGMWGDWWKACGYVDALQKAGFQAVVIDVPGHGRSTKSHDPADYEMDKVRDGILEVLDGLGVDSFVAWGQGTGGTIVQALAYTGRVTLLVTGACALGFPKEFYEMWAKPLRDEAARGDFSALRERLGESPGGLPPLEEVNDLQALAAFLGGNPWGRSAEELRDLGIVLAAYQGEEDHAVDMGEMQAQTAGATFIKVPGGIRASLVNSTPVLEAVLPLLERSRVDRS
jgi:pimeloyl-ACP methyl ester carboxylesterase